jgi:glycosyltransferase involved in cell wall biosynthesis
VCLAAYNGANYIEEQLRSIIPQLREGDEIVLSDDGSTDDTLERVRGLGHPIRIVGKGRAGGVVKNFERVLAAAEGDAMVLCDQDDVWLPGHLDRIREGLQRAQLVITNGQLVDQHLLSDGKTVFETVGRRRGFWPNLAKSSFIGCCMAFRRELRDRTVPFPRSIPWHDWYIGLVAECTGRVERIDTISILYRRHGANFSETGEKSRNSLLKKVAIRLGVSWGVLVALSRGPKHGTKHGTDADWKK